MSFIVIVTDPAHHIQRQGPFVILQITNIHCLQNDEQQSLLGEIMNVKMMKNNNKTLQKIFNIILYFLEFQTSILVIRQNIQIMQRPNLMALS